MRIEKYTARDSRTAMAQVRAELGADALILANRRVGGLVEVTAAIDVEEAIAELKPRGRTRSQGLAAGTSRRAADTGVPGRPVNEIQLKTLEKELHRLRGILESELGSRSWQDSTGTPATESTLRQRLLRMGLSRTLTGELLDGHLPADRLEAAWRAVLGKLTERILVQEADDSLPAITAIYGGTGVGKTSTLASLAGRDIQRLGADAVGLVTLDNYRIGAQEQLASFADALQLPLFTADSAHTLSLALRKLRGRRIYIDTAGMSQHDARLREQYELIRRLGKPVSHLLVLAASAQASQSRALASIFGSRALSGAIISKVDEAQSLGGVLDVVIGTRLPLYGFSTGQRIPEDFREPQPRELVRRAALLSEQGSRTDKQAVERILRATA